MADEAGCAAAAACLRWLPGSKEGGSKELVVKNKAGSESKNIKDN